MTEIDNVQLKKDLSKITEEVLKMGNFKEGDLFVLGCSTSEIRGGKIGKDSSAELGELIIKTLTDILDKKKIDLAVQGCEHINRALTMEREAAEKRNYQEVTVVPALHAGGACSVAAYKHFKNPVVVEKISAKGGMDIGDTFIGMHIKHVQIPLRPTIKTLGYAHVTAATSRPKLIGGERARYKPY